METTAWIAATASAMTVVVTTVYAFYTYKILIANQKLVSATERQICAQTRPYISIRAITRPASPIFQLSISNVGHSMARKVRLSLSRDIYQFGQNQAGKHLNVQPLFNSEYEAFPPGVELVIDLGRSWDVVDSDDPANLCPAKFSVTARYSSDERSYEERTEIDLEMYRATTVGDYGMLHEAKEINMKMGLLRDELTAMRGTIETLMLPSKADSKHALAEGAASGD
jgi:hypothetical protein